MNEGKNLFCIIVTYNDKERVAQILDAHRAYLRKGYEAGFLLASGPQEPKVGGCIIGKFASKEGALEFIKSDPYNVEGVASYEIIEFNPILHANFLKPFLV